MLHMFFPLYIEKKNDSVLTVSKKFKSIYQLLEYNFFKLIFDLNII